MDVCEASPTVYLFEILETDANVPCMTGIMIASSCLFSISISHTDVTNVPVTLVRMGLLVVIWLTPTLVPVILVTVGKIASSVSNVSFTLKPLYKSIVTCMSKPLWLTLNDSR